MRVGGDFPRIHRYTAESQEALQQHRQRLMKLRTMMFQQFGSHGREITNPNESRSPRSGRHP